MKGDQLTDAERQDWLRLIRSENVGPVTFRRVLERYGSATEALRQLPDMARRGGRSKPLRICSKAEAERELKAIRKLNARLVCWMEPDYPTPLGMTEDAPPVLTVLGHAHLLTKPAVGIVGARNGSTNGCRLARDIAAGLGRGGYTVVSGLARGIDTAAHEGSLETGTVAVVAGGVDHIYPPENEALQHQIAAIGAVVSEQPPGKVPTAQHFPRRNRIIAGIALGLVVVEAASRSGSLITARLATEQGREVMAVPGSPLDPRNAGSNGLLKQGATLVESAADVMAAVESQHRLHLEERLDMHYTFQSAQAPSATAELAGEAGDRARAVVLSRLGHDPVPVDVLIRDCHLSAASVHVLLTELELAGRIERFGANVTRID